MKRVFLIVLDSFGIGALPDSESFGDVGVNTLASCCKSEKLQIPNMIAAGLGNIQGVDCLPKVTAAAATLLSRCSWRIVFIRTHLLSSFGRSRQTDAFDISIPQFRDFLNAHRAKPTVLPP